jgi:hypothetical protein
MGSFERDGIVIGRVDAGIGDANVAARIEIDPVAVGIDLDVVDGQVVDAGGQDAEMAAVRDGEIPQRHVMAKLQGDGFIAACSALPARESLSRDPSGTVDGHVFQAFTPDQAVVEVAVTEILKLVPCVGLRRIVLAAGGTRLDDRSRFQP